MDDGVHRYVWLLDTDEELLFDRRADPYCLTNLAADPAASQALQALRHAMLRTHVTHPSPKTGRAATTPGVSHGLSRSRLERTRPS